MCFVCACIKLKTEFAHEGPGSARARAVSGKSLNGAFLALIGYKPTKQANGK